MQFLATSAVGLRHAKPSRNRKALPLSSRLLLFSGNLVVFLRPPRVPFFLLGHANDNAGHFETGAIPKLDSTATSLPNPVQPDHEPDTHGGRALADLLCSSPWHIP